MNNLLKKTFSAFLAALVFPALFYGQYKFINIGEEKGLSSLKINDLFQDSYGFVWVSTPHGLNRFDGYGCVQYFNVPGDTASISSSHISKSGFAEDADCNLWIATHSGGLNFFNRKTEKFTSYRAKKDQSNSISMDKLFDIEPDGKGGLWIGTGGCGFDHFDPKSKVFRVWKEDENHPGLLMSSGVVVSLKQDKPGRLWVGTNRGACRFDPETENFEYFPWVQGADESLSDEFVTKIFEDSKGNIWFGTSNGLNRWDAAGGIFVKYFFAAAFPKKEPGYDYVLDILEDGDGWFWLGTIGGLIHFNPTDGKFERVLYRFNDSFSIQKGAVNTILKDRLGNIWFGTDNGISILNQSGKKLNDEQFLPAQEVFEGKSLTEGINAVLKTGRAYLLATQAGIFRYQPGQPVQKVFSGNFSSLFYDAETGEIYAGTTGDGFFRIDSKDFTNLGHVEKIDTREAHDPNHIKGFRLYSFAKDPQGFIWIAADGCLNRYDPVSGRVRQFYDKEKKNQNSSSNTNRHLLTDRQGNLWIASWGGVSKLPKAELLKPFADTTLHFEHFQHRAGNKNSISSDVVFCLLEGKNGKIWMGTEAGLNCFDPATGKWQWFFEENGLPSNEIMSLVEDRNGDIWIGTAFDGLGKFDHQSGRFLRFTKKDGLSTGQFRPNSGLFTPDGFVVMGGVSGLVGFNPEGLFGNREELPPLYFTDFQIFNKTVSIGEGTFPLKLPLYNTKFIEVSHDQKVISFQFTALNFISPEKQVYRYRLDPFHDDWQYNGPKREVTFTNLDPGEYRLQVETSSNGHDWAGTALTLCVHPPWYQTWWAYLFYAVAIGGALFTIRRYELRRQLTKAEARHFKELDTIKNQLYTNITHEFRTPLTVILGMAEQVKNDPANWFNEGLKLIRRNGQQLLNLVNQMLDLSKIESGQMPLHLVQGDVVSYSNYLTESFQSLAEGKDIRLHFLTELKELQMDYDAGKLQQVVSNLLANAIKFTPSGGNVYFEIKKDGQQEVVLSIRDTGFGIAGEDIPHIFDRFYQVDASQTRRGEGTGIGLALVKELVKLMGGSIEVESKPGAGTKFTLRLAITRTAEVAQPGIIEPILPLAAGIVLEKESEPDMSRSERPVVLLIEDNPDVITYLASFLAAGYQIETAANGKIGVEKAIELIPDLVVSDVMMPEKDGFEVCETLKTDERTSHIPVILLTAKTDHASKIEGLSHGADAYLAKPFSKEELLVRIEKLIDLRRQLQERFKKTGELLKVLESQTPGPEEVFLQKLIGIVEAHIADEHFGIAELGRKSQMSRSQLFRKLKALTGNPASRFIRSIRLEKARVKLETTDWTIAEVGFATGFQDPAYFSRMFHKEFGMPPSEMRQSENPL